MSVEFLLDFLQHKQNLSLIINSVDQGGWRLIKDITITVRILIIAVAINSEVSN